MDHNQSSVFQYDLPMYGVEISDHTILGNSILYHPKTTLLNHYLLDSVKKTTCSANGHVLIIAPTKYAAKQHTQFLRRHLLTGSIGSEKDERQDIWPKVIVVETSTLCDLCSNGLNINLDLIIFLECHDAMQDETVIKFMAALKDIGSEHQPTINCFTSCIVSDQCQPDAVRKHIRQQEKFYGSKLISICDHLVANRIFPVSLKSMNAFEKEDLLSGPCIEAVRELNIAKDLCSNFYFHFNEKFSQISQASSELFVTNTLTEIEHQMEELGEYGGSIAALAAFRPLVRLYTFADSSPGPLTKHMLSHLVCCLAKFRKILEDDMFRVQICERAERFSSNKLKALLNQLKDMPKSHRSLIVVQNPNTASILTLILQKVALTGRNHTHIKPELMVKSTCIPLSDSWEDILAWERNVEVYSRFISETTNTLILSGEPQGIDLPLCDLVLVWDKIDKFSNFLKAKNYLKGGSGKLILFIDKANLVSYEKEIQKFEKMDIELKKILTEDSDNEIVHPVGATVFRTPSGIEIEADTAVTVVNGYCESLPHDKFTINRPVWKMEKSRGSPTLYCATLYLPRVSPLSEVKSVKMTSWQAAQQNAALVACQELYAINELNDALLILKLGLCKKYAKSNVNKNLDFQRFFESELELHNLRRSSTSDKKSPDDEAILCDIIYPESLTSAQPKPGVETYVHRLEIAPVSEPPPPGDNRKTVLYELLCDKSTFAILSTKPVLEVCQFPVFLFGHELSVMIKSYDSQIILDQRQILMLRMFHCGIFMNVLPIVQHFMQFDVFNSNNSYMIAPINAEGDINWDVVENNSSVPDCRELTHDEKMALICTTETHERTMVKPYYRYLNSDQVYLVSEVCTDMNADSCFPTEDFDSFLDYYRGKYNIILERPELPLLEAYLINTKVNGLLPRARSHKLRREEKMEDFREHMVPELCMPLLFPAVLWLKLSCLPSVLHRLSRLLVIEDFRRSIINDIGVGSIEIKFDNLIVDKSCLKDGSCVPKVPPSIVKRGLAIGNIKLEDRKKMAQQKKPWKETQEPVDIHRHMESLNFVEIRYLDEYLIKSKSNEQLSSCESKPFYPPAMDCGSESDSSFDESGYSDIKTSPLQEELPPQFITLLKPCGEDNLGPQQSELLAVFTSASSCDAVNMERVQVLGNSFLNFAVSVYAYQFGLNVCGSRTLACLQTLHSTFMSKANLESCCEQKHLCGRIKVLDFTPGEWIPPCFVTPPMLKHVLKEQEISPNVLQQIQLSEAEQLDGTIEEDSENEILEVLSNFVNRGSSRREEVYIDRQYVSTQTAAGCVEALVGTYFKSCGWQGALKVIGWLELLPSSKLQNLLDCENLQASITVASLSFELPTSCEPIEQSLHYNFHNKLLLIQAVTHESFINPAYQGSMHSLAFLGSGVLDFLVTCYIYEHFTELSPSDMRRLREILSSTSSLAFLAVRHNFHKHLLLNSASLLDAVDRFVKLQKGCQQLINDEVQLLLEEHECESPLEVEVPNALAKLIPSLIGAVYLDSGKNLSIVWDTFKRILLPELGSWRPEVPLSIVDLLKDLSPAAHQVIFSSKTEQQGKIEVTCRILVDNTREEVFVAQGSDESKTKTHSAKLALRNLLGSSNFCY